MKGALDVLLSAPEFDLVVAVPGSSARFQPELAVQPLIDCASAAKPLAAFVVPEAPKALANLTAAGIPNFRTPEACADAIAAAFVRKMPRQLPELPQRPPAQHAVMLDELEAYGLLRQWGIPHAEAALYDGNAAASPVSFPLAVKILSRQIAHKSDIGGVALNIANGKDLREAASVIRANAARAMPGADTSRLLVQSMTDSLGEVLVGYRYDAQTGPMVMLAAGGILTELYQDRTQRLAPVDEETALEMIGEVKGLRALSGFRGKKKGDLKAVAQTLVRLSQLAVLKEPFVLEAEINPLLVREDGKGAVAVDALVRLAQ